MSANIETWVVINKFLISATDLMDGIFFFRIRKIALLLFFVVVFLIWYKNGNNNNNAHTHALIYLQFTKKKKKYYKVGIQDHSC